MTSTTYTPPKSILIIGSGVFGLSTAYALSQRPLWKNTQITVLDRSTFPSLDGSSIDTSRIIRPDYFDPAYAHLAARAQDLWRDRRPGQLGGDGRYTESGLVLVANAGRQGEEYVKGSYENVRRLMDVTGDADGVKLLPSRQEIVDAVGTGGGSGDWGYLNRRSGWADAEAGMVWLRGQTEATGRVSFIHGEATELLTDGTKILGVKLANGKTIEADLVVVAAGAWSGRIVDLSGRAVATGQVLAYLDLTAEEQEVLGKNPVLLNMSTGMFIIPPRNRVLKVARHGYGYSNRIRIKKPGGGEEYVEVSLPRTKVDDPDQWIPMEGEAACREALREMIPSLADRPFTRSKVCWYTDTPKGDFLITYHPDFEGLFVATGGSGHGYKFLPVIGDSIADCIEHRCPPEFQDKWSWPANKVDNVVTEDGSRGGLPGLIFDVEIQKGSR